MAHRDRLHGGGTRGGGGQEWRELFGSSLSLQTCCIGQLRSANAHSACGCYAPRIATNMSPALLAGGQMLGPAISGAVDRTEQRHSDQCALAWVGR